MIGEPVTMVGEIRRQQHRRRRELSPQQKRTGNEEMLEHD